jgi:hypothetical protein
MDVVIDGWMDGNRQAISIDMFSHFDMWNFANIGASEDIEMLHFDQTAASTNLSISLFQLLSKRPTFHQTMSSFQLIPMRHYRHFDHIC